MNPLRKLSIPASSSSSQTTPKVEAAEDEVSFSMRPDDYELGNPIGYGSSAMVYIAKYLPLNKIVAVKVIDLDNFERNQIDELRREIQIMSLSRHPNLLPVYGSFVNGPKLFIVTPFLSAGSLLDIMKTAYPHGIDESCIATILKQALQGLEYLHRNGLIHRDVKAGNLLMDGDGLVQLADFGVSSSLMETGERKGAIRKTFVGTPCWMAPEVMQQSGYDYKADIWSFGITAMELATGHAPFAKYPPLKVMMMTLNNEPPTLDRDQTYHKYGKAFKDLIDSCLQKDPSRRPSAEKLLQHAFFKLAIKKKDHLATDLLTALPPITRRAHIKKTEPRFSEDVKGMSWDFSSSSETENSPDASKTPADIPILSYARGALGAGGGSGEYKPSPLANASDLTEDATPVVTPHASNLNSNHCAEIKKGRFSVTEQQDNQSLSSQQQQQIGLAVDSSNTYSNVSPVLPLEGKARFSIQAIQSDSSNSTSPVLSLAGSSPRASRFTVTANDAPNPLSANADKRSRFEVHSVDDENSTSSASPLEISPNLSPSVPAAKNSRFATSLINEPDETANDIGSFAYMAANSVVSPPASANGEASTITATPSAPAATLNLGTGAEFNSMASNEAAVLHERLDTIQRQNSEQQKLLNELLVMMARSGMGVPAGSPAIVAASGTIGTLTNTPLEQQDARVEALLRENKGLLAENETLRLRQAELERKLGEVITQFQTKGPE